MTTLHPLRPLALAVAALAAAPLAARTGGAAVPAAAARVAVDVQPSSANVPPGGTAKFAAAVTGSADTGVTWSVVESGGGAVDTTGLYTAPAAGGTFHVRAASRADPTAIATAQVVVAAPTPVTVTVTPAQGAVASCRTLTFSAAVANAADASVTWSVQEGAAGGTVTSAGVYTAPNVAGTYHVVATSVASPAATAVAPVVVTDQILGVAVTPSTVTVPPGGTAQLTATVTTTCGSFATAARITATGAVTLQ